MIFKRNNYVDRQNVDLDDFQTEQQYFLNRLQDNSKYLGQTGIVDLVGLKVLPDTICSELVGLSYIQTPISGSPDITAPNPQNFTLFPGELSQSTSSAVSFYTVFQTQTQNLQRVDLKITLGAPRTTENLDLIVQVKQLVDPTNPKSPLANRPALAQIQLKNEDIPDANSAELIELDFSNENSGQGVSVIKNGYYAITIEYRRALGSTTSIRVFHQRYNKNTEINPDLFSWILTNQTYQQSFVFGTPERNGLSQQIAIYSKIHTSAISVTQGLAFIDGKRVEVLEGQYRFLEIPDRRSVDDSGEVVRNYVVLFSKDLYTNPEVVAATRNKVNTRVQDYSEIKVMTQPQWEEFIKVPSPHILLATVTDSNIVSIFKEHVFEVPSNNKLLAFHDWLNPNNQAPTTEALEFVNARPTDFTFFVTNVPRQVPLTDISGNLIREKATVYDETGTIIKRAGDPVLDEIVRLVVSLSMSSGNHTRTFELAVTSEIGSQREFRNYGGSISNLSDNPFDDFFSYNLDTAELAPNIIYNFIAYTKRGNPIYIQDYNHSIFLEGTSVREKTFTTFIDENSTTIVINEDLRLGTYNPTSDGMQSGVVQYVPALVLGEVPTPIGAVQTEVVEYRIETLDSSNSFTFPYTPIVKSDLVSKIRNSNSQIESAIDGGDIEILVDNGDSHGAIDITFSGFTDRDKGGNGAAILLMGQIDDSVILPTTSNYLVKVRNDYDLYGARDNTNYSSILLPTGPAEVGGGNNIRTFSILARGFDGSISPFSNAGFNDGDEVFIYINDQLALDQNGDPVKATFDSGGSSTIILGTIYQLGPKKYLREKIVRSIEETTLAAPGIVLLDVGLDLDETQRAAGQIIFNDNEIPTAINSNASVVIKYNGIEIKQSEVSLLKLKYKPIGTKDGFKIANTNIVDSGDEFISVPEAFALTSEINEQEIDESTFRSIAIFCDGINITSLNSPIGQKTILCDDGSILQPGEIAFNPDDGTIQFYKETTVGGVVTEAPTDFTRITIGYFKLDKRFVFNSQNDTYYDSKYDINNDGHIDELDLNTFNRAFGSKIGDVNYLAVCDFNNDGKIDNLDLDAFRQHFGTVALGEYDYSNATTARLGALLVLKENNYLERIPIVSAFSRSPDQIAPTGRTVLFIDRNSPITKPGNYQVIFGFAAAMKLGFSEVEVQTARPLVGKLNLNNIEIFETIDPTNKRMVTSLESSTIANQQNLFDSLITFSPAISETGSYTIRSLWSERGLAVTELAKLIIPQKYERNDRKVFGPFSLEVVDFNDDGTELTCRLDTEEATLVDGSNDNSRQHIKGTHISGIPFTAHLTVVNSDGQSSTLWTWHDLYCDNSGIFKINYNESLFIDHRVQGRDKVETLTPFGLGRNQIALKPEYLGGDLKNNLANISLIRSDQKTSYIKPHDHTSNREGGLLTSSSIFFRDELARLETGDMSETVYKLLDIIEDQQKQIDLLRSIQGLIRWDSGSLYYDSADLFWDN